MTDQTKPSGEDAKLEQPENKPRWLLPIIALIILLILAGATGYFWWKSGQIPVSRTTGAQSTPPAATPVSPATTTPSQIQTPAATSTSELPTNATSTDAGLVRYNKLGKTARLFQGDAIYVLDNNAFPAYFISVMDFTDSRCPEGVKCVWAGERGIELQITLEGTEALPRQVILSETTRRTARVSGLKMTLVEIGDEKGGTYADIKFE